MRRIIVAFKESTVSDYTYGIKLRLHTAINRADFVSWWSNIYRTRKRSLPRYQDTIRLWFSFVFPHELLMSLKMWFHFLTNAFCYLRTYITCTKIRNRPDESQCTFINNWLTRVPFSSGLQSSDYLYARPQCLRKPV